MSTAPIRHGTASQTAATQRAEHDPKSDTENEADHRRRQRLQDMRPQQREPLVERQEDFRRPRQHQVLHAEYEA